MSLRHIACIALALPDLQAHAQTATRPPAPSLRQRAISFNNAKPILGLPPDVVKPGGLCSSDGLTYFDPDVSTLNEPTSLMRTAPQDLYTVSNTAEVKHLLRKLPSGFASVSAEDFFPSEHTLVTLLEADKEDSSDGRARDTHYFLSISDHDGAQSDLLSLDFHFKPLKVAAFASGDFLVLGWDVANELPVLARLKDDGTIRRFVDLGEMQRPGAGRVASADIFTALAFAAFVPFGDDILLTFRDDTVANRPIVVIRSGGQNRSITLAIPPGFYLQNVLGSDGRFSIVARVETVPSTETKPPTPPKQRLLEFNSSSGALMQEFILDKVPLSAVTCAAKSSLTAVYLDDVGSAAKQDTNDPDKSVVANPPKQLVIASVRR